MDNDTTDGDTNNSSTGTTSQVASVGFNTLKKWDTSSTQQSDFSTTSTKTHKLSRLFTRNRSSTNINPLAELNQTLNKSEDESTDTASTIESKRSTKFRFPLTKLKISSKGNKPDLTIQTSGHHSLRQNKRIGSSSTDETTPNVRRDSISSPSSTLHNFFHRPRSNSQPTVDQTNVNKDDAPASKRVTVGLSSGNSNSVITDLNFALVYKFTNADYSIDDTDGAGDHTSILDIHKKLLIPTDQYLLNKLSHRQLSSSQDIGLGITNETHEPDSQRRLQEMGKSLNFFDNLMDITRPIYLKSQERRMLNGLKHIYLGYTIEDIANFINFNYFNSSNLALSDSEVASPSRKLRMKPKSTPRTYSPNPLASNEAQQSGAVNFDDYKLREISQDLAGYFCRGLTILRKDFEQQTQLNKASSVGSIIDDWMRIIEIWDYFNVNVRYFLLACFQPLQKHFHETSVTENTNSIEIESILLISFRDSILQPYLIKKVTRFREVSEIFVLNEEKKELVENPKLLSKIIECLGVINSIATSDGSVDDGPISDLLAKTLELLLQLRSFRVY